MFFSRILESLPPLPRQCSAAIGWTINYQPIGVTVHSHGVESYGGLLQRCRRGRGCSEWWKNINFSWTPCTRNVENYPVFIFNPHRVWKCNFPMTRFVRWLVRRRRSVILSSFTFHAPMGEIVFKKSSRRNWRILFQIIWFIQPNVITCL